MDSDDQFWLAIWRLFGGVACVAIIVCGGCEAYVSTLQAELIAGGTDPIKLKCLNSTISSSGAASFCTILAGKP